MSNLEENATTQQRIIGLTGGIGMGKTTISNYLAHTHHIPVFDADLYARDAVATGAPILHKIVERYGSSILLPDGSLDRVRLSGIVFKSLPERRWLERQIHPFVRDRLIAELQRPDIKVQPVVVLVVPLLFEARMTDLVNEIWVVYCPRAQQVDRLMQRDMQRGDRSYQLSLEQIHSRINSQMPIEKKIKHADVVLDNSSTADALLSQVDQALGKPHIQQLTMS